FLRNVVVGGDLMPRAPEKDALTFLRVPQGTPGGVQLPKDTVAVAVAGNIPAQSIVVNSAPAVAFGSANSVKAADAKPTDVTGLFAWGTSTVQAKDTFKVFVGDGVPVALFLVTGANGSNFDSKNLLFTDQGADSRPVTALVLVTASGSSATVEQID